MEEGRNILVALLVRGYKPEFYALLGEDMFDGHVDRKVFRALKQGFKFNGDNWDELRSVAELKAIETADLITDVGKYKGWINEKDIKEFVREYRNKKAAELYEKGNIEDAIKYLEESMAKDTNVIEDYKKHLQDYRLKADVGFLGLPTGIFTLDKVTSGMRPSKVWIIGGYNAYGKTFFMTNMVNRVLDLGRRAVVFTLEMTKEDIIDRLIGERLGIGVYEIAKTIYKDKVDKEIERIEEHIEDGSLIIVDSMYELSDIVSQIKVESANGRIDVLFVDFIQLIKDSEAHSKYDALSNISTRLQEITKEVNCCSILLSQISNESQKSESSSVYGFKGAGEIGQVADVAIKIVRSKDESGDFTDDYVLDIVKNRNGQGGEIDCKITFPGGKITEESSVDFTEEEESRQDVINKMFDL
jgi:replicative DNA helicase